MCTVLHIAAPELLASRLTADGGYSDPHLSPDGSKLAFSRSAHDAVEVYVMVATGGGGRAQQMTHLGVDSRAAGWSAQSAPRRRWQRGLIQENSTVMSSARTTFGAWQHLLEAIVPCTSSSHGCRLPLRSTGDVSLILPPATPPVIQAEPKQSVVSDY